MRSRLMKNAVKFDGAGQLVKLQWSYELHAAMLAKSYVAAPVIKIFIAGILLN